MSRKLLSLLALMSTPLFAQATEERKETPLVVVSEENRPFSVAERNYVLNILARSLDSFIENFENGIDHSAPNANLLALKQELTRISVPLEGLSEEQREFLLAERKIQETAIQIMEGKNEDMQTEIVQTMQQTMQAHQKAASPHVKRLFGTGPLFDAVVIETQFDNKLRAILELDAKSTLPKKEQAAETIKKLHALAAEIRAMRL